MGDRLETLHQYMSSLQAALEAATAAPRAATLLASDTGNITVSASVAQVSTLVIAANPLRKGLVLYNNGANSIYLSTQSPASSSVKMTFILATFAHLSLNQFLPGMTYTGALYGIRNAGSGTVICTEFI